MSFPSRGGGLFESEARGDSSSWQSIARGIHNTSIYSLAAALPGGIYAGLLGGTVFTADAGANRETELQSGLIAALAIDPSTATTIYAGSPFGVNKPTDGGANWPPVNTGLTNKSVLTLAVDPTATATVYAGTMFGVFKTADGAANWASASSGLPSATAFSLAIQPSSPSTLLARTAQGIFGRRMPQAPGPVPAPAFLPAGSTRLLSIR